MVIKIANFTLDNIENIRYNRIGFKINGKNEATMYIKRHIEKVVEKAFSSFPAVLITGPRQVGKSTLLLNKFADTKNISLDDPLQFTALKQDATGFFRYYGTPLILDEVQRAPECFSVLKYMIDSNRHAGMYMLTGSQKFALMKGVSESLAGRIAVIDMLGLSDREIFCDDFDLPFLPDKEYLDNRQIKIIPTLTQLWERIHRGSMPEMYAGNADWEQFYSSYMLTYIERDVRQLSAVGDTLAFTQFMTVLASRSGELLNMASIARDVGVDAVTIKRWLSVLQASGIIYILQPFSLNISKRVVKAPKVYFTDTGLVCYLCRWLTPETLASGAMAGNIYETFVVSEVLKSYYNAGKRADVFFFRNTDGQEVDLLFYRDGKLYPIEIKKTSSPNIKDVKHFKALSTYFPSLQIAEGGIVCNAERMVPLSENVRVIPVWYI